MRWLLHGKLTSAGGDAIRRHGHETRAPADVGLGTEASAAELFEAARKAQIEILTDDPAIAQAPFEQRLRFDRTLVLLSVPPGDIEQDDAVDRLFARYKRLAPGRLYTVTGSRVKVRQLPGR